MSVDRLTLVFPIILALGASGAIGQTSPPSSTMEKTAPVAGANSFTEAQAKKRMEDAGFTDVSALRKDDQGIWRASAKQGDKQVSVSLDFRGNVVTQ
jgi:putative membrane protein